MKRANTIALGLWLLCLGLVVGGFYTLRTVSLGKEFRAPIVIAWEKSGEGLECAKCKEGECLALCENLARGLHSYQARLAYTERVFRSRVGYAGVEILGIEWADTGGREKPARPTNPALPTLHMASPDNGSVEVESASLLANGSVAGWVTYSVEFYPTLLYAGLKALGALAAVMVCVPYITRRVRRFNARFPKIPRISLEGENLAEPRTSSSAASATLSASSFAPPPPVCHTDRLFLLGSGILILALFLFQFWLGFPGYHINGDTYNSIGLAKDNWHPVFIAYVLQLIYAVFGKHLFYLYLFNLVPFYAGLLFLVWGFYLRFRSSLALLLLFPIFLGNIYFQNFVQYHSFALPMMLFCGYSMLLFSLLVPLSARASCALWLGIGLVFFFALLWRHNAIFSVYPASFLVVYLWLANRGLDSKAFTRYYLGGICICALVCLGIAIAVPNVLKRSQAYPSNQIFLHQIAGACVPADDASCFEQEWYLPGKSFQDVKEIYTAYPTIADMLAVPWYPETRVFPTQELPNLHKQWAKSIAKYPGNFLAHELRFLQAMWFAHPAWDLSAQALQTKPTHPAHKQAVSSFPESERSVSLSPLQERIYTALYTHRLMLNHFYGVGASLIAMLLAGGLLLRARQRGLESRGERGERQALLVFSFSVGFAGFFSALCIAGFSPATAAPETRYMSPILPLGVLAVVGLVAWLISRRKQLRRH